MSKRDTEKLVKEIWSQRVKDPGVHLGKAGDLHEFLFTMFQKRWGLMAAMTEVKI